MCNLACGSRIIHFRGEIYEGKQQRCMDRNNGGDGACFVPRVNLRLVGHACVNAASAIAVAQLCHNEEAPGSELPSACPVTRIRSLAA